jgi:isocitrate dehydrogenase
MNDKIKLFNEQAIKYAQESLNDIAIVNKSGIMYNYNDLYTEKFAQLIVQDCLAQVDKVDAMLDDPKEKVGVSWVGLAIAKHWGLE